MCERLVPNIEKVSIFLAIQLIHYEPLTAGNKIRVTRVVIFPSVDKGTTRRASGGAMAVATAVAAVATGHKSNFHYLCSARRNAK